MPPAVYTPTVLVVVVLSHCGLENRHRFPLLDILDFRCAGTVRALYGLVCGTNRSCYFCLDIDLVMAVASFGLCRPASFETLGAAMSA